MSTTNDTTNPPQPHGLQHAPNPSSQTLIHDLHARLTTALQQPLLPVCPHISFIVSLLQHLCTSFSTPTILSSPLYTRACHTYAEQSLILLVRALQENFPGREMRMQPYKRHLTNIRPEDTGDTNASLALRKWLIIEHLNISLSEPLSVARNLGAAGHALQIICSTHAISIRYAGKVYALAAVPEEKQETWKDEVVEMAVSALWTIALFVSHQFGGEAVDLRLGRTDACNCRQCQGVKVRRALEEAEERERERNEEDRSEKEKREKGKNEEDTREEETSEEEKGQEDEVGEDKEGEDGWVEEQWVDGEWVVTKSADAKGEEGADE